MSYIVEHLAEAAQVLQKLNIDSIEQMTDILVETRESCGAYLFLEWEEALQIHHML